MGCVMDWHKRYMEIREKLKEKFKKQGLNDDQIEIKMNSIDLEFFRHLWINGKDFTKNDKEARIKFYLDFLELKAKEN